MANLAVSNLANGGGSVGNGGTSPRIALSHPVLSDCDDPQAKQSLLMPVFGSHSGVNEIESRESSPVHSNHGSGVMFRKDIFYSGSLYNIPEYK